MKIVSQFFQEQIDFEKNFAYSLIIENSNEYYKILRELYSECNGDDGDIILSDDGKMLSFEKLSVFIYDYFNLICGGAKIDKMLKNEIMEKLNEHDFFEELSKISNIIIEMNDRVLEEIDLPISYNSEFDFNKLVSISNFKIDESIEQIEKVYSLANVFVKLKKIKIVILVGIFDYFDKDKIESLLKQFEYDELYVLMINSKDKYKFQNVKTIIIDEDLCEI